MKIDDLSPSKSKHLFEQMLLDKPGIGCMLLMFAENAAVRWSKSHELLFVSITHAASQWLTLLAGW